MNISSVFSAIVLLLAAQICLAVYPDRPIRLVVPVAPGGAVDVVGRITALNLEPVGSTPEEFAKFLREDYQRYMAVAKAANIHPQ